MDLERLIPVEIGPLDVYRSDAFDLDTHNHGSRTSVMLRSITTNCAPDPRCGKKGGESAFARRLVPSVRLRFCR